LETADILGDRARKEFDVLRQVADVLAQLLAIPVRDFGTIDTDSTNLGRPYTD